MKTLTLNVARLESISTLWIGRGLLVRAHELFQCERASAVSMVVDAHVPTIRDVLQRELNVSDDRVLSLGGGEGSKTSDELLRLWHFFSEQKLDRRSLVIAVGGGAITDVVGFAAATYMRGIPLINVPTTLLAQVDASIGGKTGINFNHIKNLIGAVNQPKGVLIDLDVLATLPPREFRSGFAEIIKHGLIADRSYFDLVTSKQCAQFSADELVPIIVRSCEIKRSVVESDESETGPRKTLNFGHTIGHAVESLALQGESPLTHGEAISIGMYGEALISHRTGRIPASDLTRITEGISRSGLPTHLPFPLPESSLMEGIARDKKNSAGKVKWTLLNQIGNAAFDIEVPHEIVREALNAIQPSS